MSCGLIGSSRPSGSSVSSSLPPPKSRSIEAWPARTSVSNREERSLPLPPTHSRSMPVSRVNASVIASASGAGPATTTVPSSFASSMTASHSASAPSSHAAAGPSGVDSLAVDPSSPDEQPAAITPAARTAARAAVPRLLV
jgi:hypothetical protein